MKITILQNGGGWITNIGNAFIDLGCTKCLKNAALTAGVTVDIHLTSSFGRWLFYHASRGFKGYFLERPGNLKNFLNIVNYAKIDYVVQWGAFLSESWFKLHGSLLSKFSNKGVKLVFVGCGMGENAYSDEEILKTREYLKKLNPYILISRDQRTFDCFCDLAEYSHNGIDCAFWINEAYRPLKLDMPEYVVFNFDKQPEPAINIGKDKHVIRTHHAMWHNFSLGQYFRMKRNYYDKKNTMISELPYDYLTLYANTGGTFSDRVHACIVTLAYGNPARLFGNPKRAVLFENLGAFNIAEKLVAPNMKKIESEKQIQIDFLSELLKD